MKSLTKVEVDAKAWWYENDDDNDNLARSATKTIWTRRKTQAPPRAQYSQPVWKLKMHEYDAQVNLLVILKNHDNDMYKKCTLLCACLTNQDDNTCQGVEQGWQRLWRKVNKVTDPINWGYVNTAYDKVVIVTHITYMDTNMSAIQKYFMKWPSKPRNHCGC